MVDGLSKEEEKLMKIVIMKLKGELGSCQECGNSKVRLDEKELLSMHEGDKKVKTHYMIDEYVCTKCGRVVYMEMYKLFEGKKEKVFGGSS